MRLIDADAADLADICCFYGSECRLEDVEKWLNEQPTVDAEPVRHGRWNTSLDGITPFCTECGRTHHLWTRLPDYCPNCGAKMDGEAE